MPDPYLTTQGITLGLIILNLIMQVINHVRVIRLERQIYDLLSDPLGLVLMQPTKKSSTS